MEQLSIFFFFPALGYGLKRIKTVPSNMGQCLNIYAIYIALPAMILLKIPGLQINVKTMQIVAMAWLVLPVAALFVVLAARIFNFSRETIGVLLLTVPLGNTSFLGIPMVEQLMGADMVKHAIVYDQLGTFIALSTYGSWVVARYGKQTTEKTNQYRQVITKMITFPPFIALIIALLMPENLFNQGINSILTAAAGSMLPVVLLAIGFNMKLLLPAGDIVALLYGLAVKLACIPLIFMVTCDLLGLDSPAIQVALLESATPPMILAGAMAVAADIKPDLAAALTGFGLIAALFTMPWIYQLITG